MKKQKLFNLLSPILIISITVLVILFSRGWRLDFQEKTVVTTGILDVTSDPRGATIFLDGEKQGKTPTVIDSLTPGNYQIELRKESYTSWTKEVKIKEEYVTKISANLFEQEKELTQIVDIPTENVYFSDSGGEAIVINTKNGEQGIWRIQLQQSFFQLEKTKLKIADLIEPKKFDLLTQNYKLIPNDSFTKAVLETDVNTAETSYFLLNLTEENKNILEISEFMSGQEKYKWIKNQDLIALESNSKLKVFDTNNQQLSIVSNWPVRTWANSDNSFYFINQNPRTEKVSLISSDLNGASRETVKLKDIKIEDIQSFTFNKEYNAFLISTEESTLKYDMKEDDKLKLYNASSEWSNTSKNERFAILYNNKTKNYKVYDFEEERLLNFVNELQISPSEYQWSPNNLKLFYRYTNEDKKNKIVSMDYDGTNFYEIQTTPQYEGELDGKLGFSSDSRKMYLPLSVNIAEEEIEEAEWEEYIFELQLR